MAYERVKPSVLLVTMSRYKPTVTVWWVHVTLFVRLVACAEKIRAALGYRGRFGDFDNFLRDEGLMHCSTLTIHQ